MRVSSVEGRTAVCRWPVLGDGAHRNVGLFGVDLLVVDGEPDPDRGTSG